MAPRPFYPGSQFRFYPPGAASAFEGLETVTIIAVGPAQPVVAYALLMFTSTCANSFAASASAPGRFSSETEIASSRPHRILAALRAASALPTSKISRRAFPNRLFPSRRALDIDACLTQGVCHVHQHSRLTLQVQYELRDLRRVRALLFPLLSPVPSSPRAAVERAILDGLGDVFGLNALCGLEIGDGPGDLQDAIIGARRQTQAFHGRLQEASRFPLHLAMLANLAGTNVRVAVDFAAAEAVLLDLAGVTHALANHG